MKMKNVNKNMNEMTAAERVEYCIKTKDPICAAYFFNGDLMMPMIAIPEPDLPKADADVYEAALWDENDALRPEMIELAWKNHNQLTPEIVLNWLKSQKKSA
jgi:hypothetical protein